MDFNIIKYIILHYIHKCSISLSLSYSRELACEVSHWLYYAYYISRSWALLYLCQQKVTSISAFSKNEKNRVYKDRNVQKVAKRCSIYLSVQVWTLHHVEDCPTHSSKLLPRYFMFSLFDERSFVSSFFFLSKFFPKGQHLLTHNSISIEDPITDKSYSWKDIKYRDCRDDECYYSN